MRLKVERRNDTVDHGQRAYPDGEWLVLVKDGGERVRYRLRSITSIRPVSELGGLGL